MQELCYNVYFDNFNSKEIEVFNIFDHGLFYERAYKAKLKYKDDFKKFAEEIKSWLMYCFWSKSEYEVVITSWPPYVSGEEIDRLAETKKKQLEEYQRFYRESARLECGSKIDIYDQVMLNWDIFIKYVWDNRKLLKKRK